MYWYVVKTKARQEKIAEQSLQRFDIEIFSPQLKESKVIRRQRKLVIRPLFPGYFFVRFDLKKHYRAVHYAHGVWGVVAFGSSLATIDEATISSIKSRFEGDYVVVKPPSFKPGQTVRIQRGALEGLEAVFEREMSAQERVVLLLNTLSSQFRVEVNRTDLAPV